MALSFRSVLGFTLGDALQSHILKEIVGYSSPRAAKFSPGIIVATPLAQALVADLKTLTMVLDRHLCGDFGFFGCFDGVKLNDFELSHRALATDDSGKLNKLAILGKYHSVLSEYSVNDQIVWVMTEDVNGTETRTTVMLPSEY